MDCTPTEENFFGQGDELVGKSVAKYFSGKEFIDYAQLQSELKDYANDLHQLLKIIGG